MRKGGWVAHLLIPRAALVLGDGPEMAMSQGTDLGNIPGLPSGLAHQVRPVSPLVVPLALEAPDCHTPPMQPPIPLSVCALPFVP